MNDAQLPKAKDERKKTPCVRVRRKKAENERRAEAGSKKPKTTNAVRTRQAAKS